jgi:hypothetical protein
MLRRCSVAASLAACLLMPWQPARSATDTLIGRYIALVIGVGNYQGALALQQPAADAAAIAGTLRARGFQIVSPEGNSGCAEKGPVIDPNREVLKAAVACFKRAAERATQAVVYFSGHSVSRNGNNYLLPAGISATDASRSDSLIDLKSILETLDEARPELSVVILDAARSTAGDVADTTPGLARIPPTTAVARVVAFSAKAGTWTDSGDAAPPGKEPMDADGASLSPYTRRLVQMIQNDLDNRSLNLSGATFDRILTQASSNGASPPGEIMNDNLVGAEIIGRLPTIGNSACDVLKWRAGAFGRCIEMATAYDRCGKDPAVRTRLQKQCSSDWKMLVTYSLRALTVAAMKSKSCAALKDLVTKYEAEPGGRDLDEFKEIQSLAQYTCATEKQPSTSLTPSATVPAAAPNTAAKRDPDQRKSEPPPAPGGFHLSDNRDIWGQDIKAADGTIGFISPDVPSCIKQCEATASCVAIGFDRWKTKCYPKDGARTALLDARSMIAVKKSVQMPSMSAAKIELLTMRNSRLSGDTYLRKRVLEFGGCRSTCDTDSACMAFVFTKSAARNSPNCELLKLVTTSDRNPAMDSGFKFQSP